MLSAPGCPESGATRKLISAVVRLARVRVACSSHCPDVEKGSVRTAIDVGKVAARTVVG